MAHETHEGHQIKDFMSIKIFCRKEAQKAQKGELNREWTRMDANRIPGIEQELTGNGEGVT